MLSLGFVTNSSSTSYLVFYDASEEDELREAVERRAEEEGGFRRPQQCLVTYDTFEQLVAAEGFDFKDDGFMDVLLEFAQLLRRSTWHPGDTKLPDVPRYKVGFVIDPEDYCFGVYDDVLAGLHEKGVVLAYGKMSLLWF